MPSDNQQPIDGQQLAGSGGSNSSVTQGTVPPEDIPAVQQYVSEILVGVNVEQDDHPHNHEEVVESNNQSDHPIHRRAPSESAWFGRGVTGRDELLVLLRRHAFHHIPLLGPSEDNGVSLPTLELLQRACADYGHLDAFFREADEAFVNALTESSGRFRIPIPLLVPTGRHAFLSFYAFLIRDNQVVSSCWEDYHGRVSTVMRRVARDLDVSRTPNLLYVRLARRDRGVFESIGKYMRRRGRGLVLRGGCPQAFSSEFRNRCWIEEFEQVDT